VNGPWHYREAERLLTPHEGRVELSGHAGYSNTVPGGIEPPSDRDIARARVHATLAHAAATALQFHLDLLSHDPQSPGSAWRPILSGTAEDEVSGS
jgi:NADPH-dependent ferric siderophore reductase